MYLLGIFTESIGVTTGTSCALTVDIVQVMNKEKISSFFMDLTNLFARFRIITLKLTYSFLR